MGRVVLQYQLYNRVGTLPTFRPDDISNPVIKLVLENYPFSYMSQLRSPHFIISWASQDQLATVDTGPSCQVSALVLTQNATVKAIEEAVVFMN